MAVTCSMQERPRIERDIKVAMVYGLVTLGSASERGDEGMITQPRWAGAGIVRR